MNFKELIIYEDDDYILINKPEGIATLNERADDAKLSIIELAKSYCPSATPSHRLDKETSGVLALSKNPNAYRHLSLQFEHRQTQKIYHAVVGGLHEFEDLGVFLPINVLKTGKARIDTKEGKPAETIFRSLKAYKNHTLVGCMPITGRLHQIRVHLAYLKAPIVADLLYGGKHLYLSELKRRFNLKKDEEEQPLIKRVALHANKLRFTLPNGEFKEFIADYPKDIKALIRQLEINS